MNTLNKMNLSLIHDLLDVLDIKRGQGDKQAKIELILSFLKKPKQLSEISLEQRDVARREKAKRKRSIQEKKKSNLTQVTYFSLSNLVFHELIN